MLPGTVLFARAQECDLRPCVVDLSLETRAAAANGSYLSNMSLVYVISHVEVLQMIISVENTFSAMRLTISEAVFPLREIVRCEG